MTNSKTMPGPRHPANRSTRSFHVVLTKDGNDWVAKGKGTVGRGPGPLSAANELMKAISAARTEAASTPSSASPHA